MTSTETPEQIFERFQQNGDPVDLAKVFDATAPQLLLLAAHVSPDGGAAEDLLQETFLVAMAKAEQWHATRPLLPWLAGILRHRAQDLARKLRLRRPAAALSDVVIAAEGVGPLGEAECSELLQRVQQALDTLESPFREALVLRLVHGLQPTEIAHALGRPPVTVRGQLKRGLEVLRGVLPVSLTSGLVLLLLPGRGIAATRAAVMAATGKEKVAAISLGGVTRPGVWMAAFACAVGLLAAGAIWLLGAEPTAPPANSSSRVETAEVSSESIGSPMSPTSADTRRDVVVVTKTEANPNKSTLRGRCVRATDGIPLAGGTATVSFGRGRYMTEDEEFRTWPDLIEVRIGFDGLFALEFEPQPLQRVFLDVATPGHTSSFEEWTSLQSGLDIDLGDIKLIPACRLQARVVDGSGAPVPNAWISIERLSGGMADATFGSWSSMDRLSDEHGRITEELLPAPGSYGIASRHDKKLFQVISPTHIDLDSSPVRTIDIVVARTGEEDSLVGRVLDEGGQAVVGLTICIHAEFVDHGNAVTADDGSFYLPLDYPKRARKLFLPSVEQRYRLLDPDREYMVGGEDVQLRVQRKRSVEVPVEVVDARTGKPVEQFGIAHELDYWIEARKFMIPPDRFYRPVDSVRYAGGRTVLTVYPGKHRLTVWPENQDLATAYMVPFTVDDTGAKPIRIELNGYAKGRLRLRNDAGKPLVGVTVKLTHSLASGPSFGSCWSVEAFARGVGGGHSTGVSLQTLTTDADGRAVFRAPIGEDRLGLRLTGPLVRWTRRSLDVVPEEGAEWDVTLPALAKVSGKVGPETFLQRTGPSTADRLAHSMVRSEDSDITMNCVTISLAGKDGSNGGDGVVMPDGSFVIDAALPGDYDVRLNGDNIGEVTVAEVMQLRAGEERQLAIDASKFVPARLAATVLVDGEPWVRGGFHLLAIGANYADGIGLGLAGQGSALMQPATYASFVKWQDQGRDYTLFGTQRCELAVGADVSQTFSFEHRVLRVKVLGPDGKPAAKTMLFATVIDYPEAQRHIKVWFRTDDEGVFVWDPAPPGRAEMRLSRDGGAVVGVVAAEAKPTTERTLQLPQ